MPSVEIENVPDEVCAVLTRRAWEAHQSLQEYLLRRLIEEASRPTVDEALARVEEDSRRGTLSPDSVVRILRDDRESS